MQAAQRGALSPHAWGCTAGDAPPGSAYDPLPTRVRTSGLSRLKCARVFSGSVRTAASSGTSLLEPALLVERIAETDLRV